MRFSVLIVDDSEPFLEVARDLLEREGVDVLGVASTTAEALAQVGQKGPDVVLVDVHLGAESGLDLARQLSTDRAGQGAAVILMSTYDEADLAGLITDCPVSGFVAKSELSAAAIDQLRPQAPLTVRGAPGGSRDPVGVPTREV